MKVLGMRSGVKAVFGLTLTVYALALPGCEDDEPSFPARPPPPAAPTPTPAPGDIPPLSPEGDGIRAGAEPSAPSQSLPRRRVSLAEEAAVFTTLASCMDRIALPDPFLADVLDDLGLDSIRRDACRVVEAAHTRSTTPCADVTLEPLADRCRVASAVARGEPELCPQTSATDPTRGRDPLCLALARRDSQPCEALEASDAIACRAAVRQTHALCNASPTAKRRAACTRLVERWRGFFPERSQVDQAEPRATLERSDGSRSFDALAGAGVVVVTRGSKRFVVFDVSRGRVHVRLRALLDEQGRGQLERLEITEAGSVLVDATGAHATATVVFSQHDAGKASLSASIAVRARNDDGMLRSFALLAPVRDVVVQSP